LCQSLRSRKKQLNFLKNLRIISTKKGSAGGFKTFLAVMTPKTEVLPLEKMADILTDAQKR